MPATLARLAMGLWLTVGLAAPALSQTATAKKARTAEMPGKSADKIDLNTATPSQLEGLPGLSPTIAKEILKARPFKSVDEIKALKGVTPTLFASWAPRIRLGDESARKVALPAGKKVDLNAATVEELEELPGIGPSRSAAIIKARPFKTVDEVMKVNGISPAVFAEIRPHIRLTEPPAEKSYIKRSTGRAEEATPTKEAMPKKAAIAKDTPKEDAPERSSKKKLELAAGKKIDINTATAGELEELHGVGPVRAAAIIKARPFATIEDIMKVDGIKEGIFGQIKDHIKVK